MFAFWIVWHENRSAQILLKMLGDLQSDKSPEVQKSLCSQEKMR
jgi:hypothetical protein